MPDASTVVREARANVGLSARRFAALAGVSPSTVTRTENATIEPTWGTVVGLLGAAGFRPGYPLQSQGDPAAVSAARRALGDLDGAPSAAETRWLERWQRIGVVDDDGRAVNVRALGLLAGIAARIDERPQPKAVAAYRKPLKDLTRDLADAGVRYAVTALPAAQEVPTSRVARPVIYVDDLAAARAVAGEAGPGDRRVTFLSLDDTAAVGTRTRDDIAYVSRAQGLIDAYASPGRASDQADAIAAAW